MPSLLDARGISKRFPGVQALRDVNLRLERGEIVAVCGENGAGKSTLMRILAGIEAPDSGTILLDGAQVPPGDSKEAQLLGITLIHQELNLATHLDVAGNVFLGHEPTWGGPLQLLSRRIYADAQNITKRLGLDGSPHAIVVDLPVGKQQLVEIARALALRSRLLILDEPTSSLTEREAARLFSVLRDLKNEGIGILYISHRLKEMGSIADRIVVLRDGSNSGELAREEISHDAIVRLMVGRDLQHFFPRARAGDSQDAEPAITVCDLRWSRRQSTGISFDLYRGEIVGIAGLMGAGRTELGETLFGVRKRLGGRIVVDGTTVDIRNPAHAIAAGILLVPEDRRLHGLFVEDTVKHNVSFPSLDRLSTWGLMRRSKEGALSATMVERLNVKTPSLEKTVALLSGGNQQKIVLAKWLACNPRLLILDEPTRGIDVGAKSEIYALMDKLTNEGLPILVISSDLEEIMGICDRVLIMHEGAIAGELPRDQLSEEAIMHYATGGSARVPL